MSLRIALVGVGKIARDQHVPAMLGDSRFELMATADPRSQIEGVPAFTSLSSLLANGPEIDAVVICTPPQGRAQLVAQALRAGLHVMMEKPPATTLGEMALLRATAQDVGRTLFAAWHSREAGAVDPARAWLATRAVTAITINWKEDIRRWHPGQDWILDVGGFGVFDPGINALSIATAILPDLLTVTRARLVIPAGRHSPIAADVSLACGGAEGLMTLSFLESEAPSWTIEVNTADGVLCITEGGCGLNLAGENYTFTNKEYSRLYDKFANLIEMQQIELDDYPSRLVADALTIGKREIALSFEWN